MYDFIGTLGRAAIITGFIASAVAVFAYLRSFTKPDALRLGRGGYHVMAVSVMVASAALLILIVKHQFQFHYVWSYSSRDLPLGLLMSTFFAGQEGSFLLWALMTILIGVVLMPYTEKHGYEKEVMPIFTLIGSFLLLLTITKNPFALIDAAVIPADGRGLNPLLQNFWMQIHPPVLFAGFAAVSVPFAWAVGALIKKQHQEWIDRAFPWVVGGSMILGMGIMLGGYWAYETLGWGGWWGWDPVENSSLLPWIVCTALVHSMLVQKRTKGLMMTNYVLAIITFVLVLYSTFLTRSGVLGDASVHSFVDPGRLPYTLLVLFMFMFIDIGHSLLFIRFTKWGKNLWEKFTGVRRYLLLYLIIVGPSIPVFAQISGDLVPVFHDAQAAAGSIAGFFLFLLEVVAHGLNILSYLWIPALVFKLGLIVYTFTGRLHSETEFQSFEILSRETWLGIGSAVLLGFSVIVILGTSLPIIPHVIIDAVNSVLGIFSSTASLGNTVSAEFYDALTWPIGVVIGLITGFTILLKWRANTGGEIWKKMRMGLVVSIAITAVLVALGIRNFAMILLTFAGVFSIVLNVQIGVKILRGNPRFTGAYVAHIGVAMMLIGIVTSGFYGQKIILELEKNKPQSAYGYDMTYIGYEPFYNGERFHFLVRLEKDGQEVTVLKPVMFMHNYGGSESLSRNPDIAEYIHKDIYLEPQGLLQPDHEDEGEKATLAKGESIQIGDYEITFERFDLSNMDREAMMENGGEMRIGGIFRVKKYGGKEQVLKPFVTTRQGEMDYEPASVENGDLEITLVRMNVDPEDPSKSQAEIRTRNPQGGGKHKAETLIVEASLKPFMSLIWGGVTFMMIGLFIAILRRAHDARKTLSRQPVDTRVVRPAPEAREKEVEPAEKEV